MQERQLPLDQKETHRPGTAVFLIIQLNFRDHLFQVLLSLPGGP